MINTPKRLDTALSRLAEAFHSGKLNAYTCSACAVGNMCDGYHHWGYARIRGEKPIIYDINKMVPVPSTDNDSVFCSTWVSRQVYDIIKDAEEKSGYPFDVLLEVERIFMKPFEKKILTNNEVDINRILHNKEIQFEALCDVVAYLCKVEGIDNVMDYQKVFETKELQLS